MGVFSLFNFMHLSLRSALEAEAPLFPGGNLPSSQGLRCSSKESSAEMLSGPAAVYLFIRVTSLD